jgi:predicted SAM-dependent methyltransferase
MPTDEARTTLAQYCQGMGIDVGYGGMSITPNTINVDLPQKRQHGGDDPQHLYGSGDDLYWFKDGVLDYVYSSHLLENFKIPRMRKFIREWLRVLKPGGYLVLYLPDQQKYEDHCAAAGAPHNPAHQYKELNYRWFIENVLEDKWNLSIIHYNEAVGKFSFEIVLKKGGK